PPQGSVMAALRVEHMVASELALRDSRKRPTLIGSAASHIGNHSAGLEFDLTREFHVAYFAAFGDVVAANIVAAAIAATINGTVIGRCGWPNATTTKKTTS